MTRARPDETSSRLADWVTRTLAQAPPSTPSQREHIARLFRDDYGPGGRTRRLQDGGDDHAAA